MHRAGVKYVLSNTNTNTNTKIWIFQIQIQICCSILIQIQIQIHRFKYKYKYKYGQQIYLPKLFRSKIGQFYEPKIYAHGLCFLMFRWRLKLTPLHFRKFHWQCTRLLDRDAQYWIGMLSTIHWLETLCYKGPKKRVESIHFSKFFQKNRSRNKKFLIFFSNIRVKTIANFPETWKSWSRD